MLNTIMPYTSYFLILLFILAVNIALSASGKENMEKSSEQQKQEKQEKQNYFVQLIGTREG